jgi:hypothetical protein
MFKLIRERLLAFWAQNHVLTTHRRLHSMADANEMLLKRGPVIRPKLKNCDSAFCQVLLMSEILVSNDDQFKAFAFCAIKQFAISNSAPSHFDGS